MQLIKRAPDWMALPVIAVSCLALAGMGWSYSTYLTPHGVCVGELATDLAVREFSRMPDRAQLAAEMLCNRAGDNPGQARALTAGRHT